MKNALYRVGQGGTFCTEALVVASELLNTGQVGKDKSIPVTGRGGP
jgi:hypothetical protein